MIKYTKAARQTASSNYFFGKYSAPLFDKEGLGEILLDTPSPHTPFFKGGKAK
jgi:hypothetical protein